MFARKQLVSRIVAAVGQQLEELSWAMLWLLSYTFLLRVPSEALHVCKGCPSDAALSNKQTLIWLEDGELCIRILRRKNRPKGSGVLTRKCCCRGDIMDVCPVHTLWKRFFCHLPDGAEPWSSTSSKFALARLRQLLHRLGIKDADLYGTHDFRRGHAEVR